MYLGSWKIDDYLTFPANTHRADTGAATDGDGVPTYRIYEDETDPPILTGNMAILDDDDTTGFYTERIQLTAASGLEKGKSYNIYIEVTVNSVKGTITHCFQMEAEVDANTVSGTVATVTNVGTVTGNVNGSVASVVGAVGSVTGAVGSVTGAVGSVTGAVGSVAGNVDGSVASVVGAVGSVTGAVGSVAGNVDGSVASVVGHTAQSGDGYAVVAHADYGNAKLVRSTTPANKLDVSATGEAGLDFANIKDASGAHTLTNITIPAVTVSGLVDDAITLSKFDETTAWPLVASDAGATQVARVGADSDTLETLSDQIDNVALTSELDKVPKSDSNVVWNATAQTTIQTKAAAALSAYDPPTKGEMDTGHGLLATPAEVETAVDARLDAANSELASMPTTIGSLRQMTQFIFTWIRNKKTVTSTTESLKKEDATTELGSAALSDDGTTFTKGEMS